MRGVSHERMGMPCQDAQDYRVLPDGTLLVALADGAGSAAFSDQGARCAVKAALARLGDLLQNGRPGDNETWRRLLEDVFGAARGAVLDLAKGKAGSAELDLLEMLAAGAETFVVESAGAEAEWDAPEQPDQVFEDLPVPLAVGRQDAPERAYATTLTCAIATADRLVVGQIGDGVVVAGEGDALAAVTRLQRGEYANETHFLTQPNALDQLEIAMIEQPVSSVAVMSDGLVRLALKMPEQEPHVPFFRPLFRVTAATAEPGGAVDESEAARQLTAFLGSERVNARTDDDKSLVLAVRAASLRESGERAPLNSVQ